MTLADRLERAAKEITPWLGRYEYEIQFADLRELLEEAAKVVRGQEQMAKVVGALRSAEWPKSRTCRP